MIIKVKVKTGQPVFSVREGAVWLISVRSRPENNATNTELVKKLSRLYGSARLLSGFRSKTKTLEIGGTKP